LTQVCSLSTRKSWLALGGTSTTLTREDAFLCPSGDAPSRGPYGRRKGGVQECRSWSTGWWSVELPSTHQARLRPDNLHRILCGVGVAGKAAVCGAERRAGPRTELPRSPDASPPLPRTKPGRSFCASYQPRSSSWRPKNKSTQLATRTTKQLPIIQRRRITIGWPLTITTMAGTTKPRSMPHRLRTPAKTQPLIRRMPARSPKLTRSRQFPTRRHRIGRVPAGNGWLPA